MKKLSIILGTILLVMTMFVSCSVEVNEPETNLMSLRFRTDDDASKALTASRDSFNAGDYVWYYTAEKAESGTPATGTKTEITKVGTNGNLSELVGPFSLGKWDFTLYGYVSGTTTPSDTALVYKGSVTDYTLTATTETIEVTVEPQKTTGGTGKIVVSKDITLTANGTNYDATTVTVIGVDETGDGITQTFVDGDDRADLSFDNLTAGSYKVTVEYTKDSITYATNTIYVNVWNNLTTKISGSLDEITVYEKFNATENEDGSISQVNTIDSENLDSEQTLIFDYSPATATDTGTTEILKTEVKGTFSSTGEEPTGSLSLVVYDENAVNADSIKPKFEVGITEGETEATAGFDLTLTGATITEGKLVTVTSYITKELPTEYVYMTHIKSDGTTVTMTRVDNEESLDDNKFYYESSTGKLVFKTSSFSSFLVTYSSILNTNTSKAYSNLNKAIETATAGDTLKLLIDHSETEAVTVDRNITLELNGKGLEFTGVQDAITVNKGITLTVSDTTTNSDGYIQSIGLDSASSSTIKLASGSSSETGGKLVLNSGEIRHEAKYEDDPSYVIYGDTCSDIDINGGTIRLTSDENLSGYCIYSLTGSVVIDNATIINESSNESALIINKTTNSLVQISNCELRGNICLYNYSGNKIENSTIYGNVTTGKTNTNSGTYTIENCTIYGDVTTTLGFPRTNNELVNCTVSGTVTLANSGCVKGGRYKNKFDVTWLEDGKTFSSTTDAEGYYTIVDVTADTAVATLSYDGLETALYYRDPADAITAGTGKTNAIVTIIRDCQTNSSLTTYKVAQVIVNEGVSLEVNSSIVGSYKGHEGTSIFINKGTTVVKNSFNFSEGECSFENTGSLTVCDNFTISTENCKNTGSIIWDPTYTFKTITVSKDFINDGTLKATKDGVKLVVNSGASIKTSGGTVQYNEGEYTWSNTEDKFVPLTSGVAQNVTTNKYYSSLTNAISAANSGDEIKLFENVSDAYKLEINSTLIFDLNGKTISYGTTGSTSAIFKVVENGALTIKDSSTGGIVKASNVSTGVMVQSGGSFTLESGTIEASSSNFAVGIYEDSDPEKKMGSNGTVTIKGGTVKNTSSSSGNAIGIFGTGYNNPTTDSSDTANYAKLKISGGEISANNGAAIIGFGTLHNTSIEITGGTITSTEQTAIYHPQWGAVTISGGTITGGASAIEMRSGKLTITGGTLTATSTSFETQRNGSGSTTIGAAVAIAQHSTNLPISVIISSGGTGSAPTISGYHALYVGDPQGNRTSKKSDWATVNVTTSGGYFYSSQDKSAVVVQEDAFTLSADATYGSEATKNAHFSITRIEYTAE